MEYWSNGEMEVQRKSMRLGRFYNAPILQHSSTPQTSGRRSLVALMGRRLEGSR